MRRRQRNAAVAAAALVVALAGCGATSDEPLDSASVQDLTADTSGAFDLDEVEVGQNLSLRVSVERVLSPDSFVVPSKDTAGAPLLVLAKEHGAEPGDVLQIGGIVRLFDYEEQARAYDLAPVGTYAEFDGTVHLAGKLNDSDLPLDGS